MVNENACQLASDSLCEQLAGNRTVNTAGKSQQSLTVADLLTDIPDCGFSVAFHCPVAAAAADVVQEVAQHVKTTFSVIYLGVELHAVEFLFNVLDSGVGALCSVTANLEALRKLLDVVVVAHPCNGGLVDILKQQGSGIDLCFSSAEFRQRTVNSGAYITTEGVSHELYAVADTQNRNAQVEYLLGHSRGILKINAVRTACEDDALGVHRAYLFNGGLVGFDLAVYFVFSYAACDKLIVLTAEVENEN